MPSERPTVSVVIAAYNAEATLAEQFAALERQVGDVDFEILLCDNGRPTARSRSRTRGRTGCR